MEFGFLGETQGNRFFFTIYTGSTIFTSEVSRIDHHKGPLMSVTRRITVVSLMVAGIVAAAIAQEPAAPQSNARRPIVAGRSKVATKYGIVAASQPLAARAGVQILERGGNAIDAAIATNAVMGLVEPHYNGIGGDLFAIYYEAKTGKLYGLNAGGWAPTGLTAGAPADRRASRGCRAAASTPSPCPAPSRAGR